MGKVKCKYCEQFFDWEKEPYIKIGRRYAHKSCAELQDQSSLEEEKFKDELFRYLKEDLKFNYNFLAVSATLEKYIKEYNYTYEGMLKALKWFYEIKKNRIDKERGIVGIIPYIYQTAMDYYEFQQQAIQANSKIEDAVFERKIKEINIFSPEPKLKKPKLFKME